MEESSQMWKVLESKHHFPKVLMKNSFSRFDHLGRPHTNEQKEGEYVEKEREVRNFCYVIISLIIVGTLL